MHCHKTSPKGQLLATNRTRNAPLRAACRRTSPLHPFIFGGCGEGWWGDSPFGAVKCRTLPSSLNMLTSSTPVIGCTFSFLSAPCSFLSSCEFAGFDLRTTFRRTVPFPPAHGGALASVVRPQSTVAERRLVFFFLEGEGLTHRSYSRPPALAAWPILRDPWFASSAAVGTLALTVALSVGDTTEPKNKVCWRSYQILVNKPQRLYCLFWMTLIRVGLSSCQDISSDPCNQKMW